MADKWIRVTKRMPCPICEHGDWCSIAPDGAVCRCMRVESTTPVKTSGGGWWHRLNGSIRPAVYLAKTNRRQEAALTSVDVARRGFVWFATDNRLELADALGVSLESVEALKVGWTGEAWTIPERDADGMVVGITFRGSDGKKWGLTGGKRGLVYDDDFYQRVSPVLVVEGMSDVAACITMGLSAIGRPNNRCGGEMVAALLVRVGCKRDVWVMGENDKKPKTEARQKTCGNCGKCAACAPGRYGAGVVARDIAKALRVQVKVKFPPRGYKDVRQWLNEYKGEPEMAGMFLIKALGGAMEGVR